MIDLSLAGLLGAVIGIVVAAVAYAPLVLLVERGFKARQPVETSDEQATLALELSLLRRAGAGSRYYRVRRHRLLARPSLRGLSHRGPTETARRHGLPERMAP
jgi:hypothetical protein